MFYKKIIVSSLIFLCLDFVYLFTMKTTFEKQVERIQGSPLSLKVLPTILCYLFLIGGLYYFVLRENKPWWVAGLLGIVIYGVYETTNLAILDKWNWKLAIIDVLWGGILFSLTAISLRAIFGEPLL